MSSRSGHDAMVTNRHKFGLMDAAARRRVDATVHPHLKRCATGRRLSYDRNRLCVPDPSEICRPLHVQPRALRYPRVSTRTLPPLQGLACTATLCMTHASAAAQRHSILCCGDAPAAIGGKAEQFRHLRGCLQRLCQAVRPIPCLRAVGEEHVVVFFV